MIFPLPSGARILRFQPLIFQGVCEQNTFSSIEWTLKFEPPSQRFAHHFPYDWWWWPAIQPAAGQVQGKLYVARVPGHFGLQVQSSWLTWGWTAAVNGWAPDVVFSFQEIQQGGYMRAIQEGLSFWRKKWMPTLSFSLFWGGMLMSKFRKVSVSAFHSLYQPPQPCQAERPQQPEWPTRLKPMERWMWILRWRT